MRHLHADCILQTERLIWQVINMGKLIKRNKKFLIVYIVCIVIGIILPNTIASTFAMNTIIMSLIWSIMGIGWNFIGGYAGQVSNGHAFYYAIGAYSVALGADKWGLSPWMTMWIGIFISVVVAFVLGKPLLRLNGAYFLIATMAVAECARIIFLNTSWLGAATGIMFLDKKHSSFYTLQFLSKVPFYYILLAIVVLLVLLSKFLDKSKFGYYLRAIKANEQSAQSAGINTPRYKVYAYMLSAAIVSLAGSLYAPYVQYVDPYTLLTLDKSTMICLVAVMGGIGTVAGPILGAFVMTFISEYARAAFAGTSGMNMLVYGIVVVLIVLYMPDGILSMLHRIRDRLIKLKKRKEAAQRNG